MPDFLLIGAQKAGTTWLSSMLRQHPDIYIPPSKELHFFNLRENYERGIDWYLHQFDDHGTATCIGECTPNYLWVGDLPDYVERSRKATEEAATCFLDYPQLRHDAHRLVRKHVPDAKLVVSLRNPVERAVSSYYHAVRHGKFSPGIGILEAGGREGILAMGFYHQQLTNWMEVFPRDRFRILIYEEDVVQRKRETLRSLFRFLGVDENFTPEGMERAINARPSLLFIRAQYHAPRLARLAFRAIPALQRIRLPALDVSEEERLELRRLYEEDIGRLEGLLGRSLDIWKA